MDTIPSFTINHNLLLPGIYVSRIDSIGGDFATTFDIRMKAPNREPAIQPNALHTIEHIVATYLRNDPEWKDRIVYWGPMGCLTGNYLIVKGRPAPQEICPLVKRAFAFLRDFDGVVPGTTPDACGNCLLHDLPMAKYEARKYLDALEHHPCFEYPITF